MQMRNVKKERKKQPKSKKLPSKSALRDKDIVDRLEAVEKRYSEDIKKILRDSGIDPDEVKY